MTRVRSCSVAATALTIGRAMISPASGPTKSRQLTIGVINNTHAFDGAGCYVQFLDDYKRHNSQYIFVSDYGRKALVNLSGRDVSLVWVGGTEAKVERAGDHSSFRFSGDGVRVAVDYTVVRICAPDDEKCEATAYDAILTVSKGGSRAKVFVKAICGS